ncbi:MAG: aromatic ring-hydroxylating dioxygenase subunit alpha, partial [Burkholderiaceae bacterium]
MPFCTHDPNVRNDWLTIGAAGALQRHTAERPWTTRLLGNTVTAWRGADGQAIAQADDRPLPVQERYGYLWVWTGDGPQRPLFALPEFDEPGRRIVDCGGIGVATSGLRVVENFLDMGHFPYIHTGTLGKVPHTEVAPYRVQIDP